MKINRQKAGNLQKPGKSQKKGRMQSLLSDTFVFAIGNASIKFINFFLLPFYTLHLTTAEFGIADTLYMLVELLVPVLTLCIAEAVFRFSIDKTDHSALLSIGLRQIGYGMLILGVLCLIVFLFTTSWFVLSLFLLCLTYSLQHLFGFYLRGSNRSGLFVLWGVIGTMAMALLSVFLLSMGASVQGYLFGLIFGQFVSAAGYFFHGKLGKKIRIRVVDSTLRKSMLAYSLPIIPNMISWWFNNSAAKYSLLFFMNSGATGLYAAAAKVPAILNLFSSIFQQAWMYASAKAYDAEDKSVFFTTVFTLYSVAISLICSILIALMPFLAGFILKGDFYEAWKFVPALLIAATLNSYSVFFGGLYTAAKENKPLMMSTLIGAVVNVLSCVAFIPLLGIWGAVIANLLCYAAITAFRMHDTKRYVHLGNKIWMALAATAILILQVLQPIIFADHSVLIQALLVSVLILIQLPIVRSILKRKQRSQRLT